MLASSCCPRARPANGPASKRNAATKAFTRHRKPKISFITTPQARHRARIAARVYKRNTLTNSCETDDSDSRESVHPHRSVVEHRRPLRFRVRLRVLLEVIPDHRVRGGFLVRREVALEHAALRREYHDRVVPPTAVLRHQFIRGRRLWTLIPAKAVQIVHAETAHLDRNVRVLRNLGDRRLPCRVHLLDLSFPRADAEDAANVVQDDRKVGNLTRKLDDVVKLVVVQPGFERQPKSLQLSDALQELGIEE